MTGENGGSSLITSKTETQGAMYPKSKTVVKQSIA